METAVSLRRDGYRVVIVSSGAIGVGLQRMDLPSRPKHLPKVQAMAAIGQCRLMGLWDQLFERLGQPVAQILLTRNDIADRTQYLNAQNTFIELLHMGVIPIVNENDTIAVAEIKFGDNDTLSAITAGMVQADYLFLMTDVDCLYDKNPRKHPDAKGVEVVDNIADLSVDVSSAGSALGTGGMSTKIVAARLATAAGVTTVITRSSKPGNIGDIVRHIESTKDSHHPTPSDTLLSAPVPLHTRFTPSPHPIRDRHFWLLHGLAPHGTIYVDPGAANALTDHAGLLPVGIIDVDGAFAQQECVRIVQVARRGPRPASAAPAHAHALPHFLDSESRTPSGTRTPPTAHAASPYASDPTAREIGRAIVNYSAGEIRRIAGLRSTEIASVLGYADSEYVALRENVAILPPASRPATPTGVSGGGAGSAAGELLPAVVSRSLGGGLGGYVEG